MARLGRSQPIRAHLARPVVAPITLLTGLAAYYKLDEASGNAIDATGNGNTAIDHGSVGSASGEINTARTFDGSTRWLSLPSNFGAGAPSGGPFSASLWVYADATSGDQVLLGRYEPARDRMFQLWLRGTHLGVAYGTNPFDTIDDAGSISAGTWHHLAFTFSSSGVGTLYVDGSSVGSDPGPTGDFTSTATLDAGRRGDGMFPFAGRLDEFAWYNRELTAGEVSSLYNGGAGRAYSTFGAGGTPISSADSGAGSESAALVAAVASSQSATAAEGTPALLAALATVADSGTGAEGTPALLAAAASADSGTGAESATLLAGLARPDTGSGLESATLLASVATADSGAGADAGSVFAGLSVSSSDSGAGTEGAATLAAAPAAAESGAGTDGSSLAATLAGSDSGAGADAGSVFAGLSLSSSDSGTGAEGTPSLLAATPAADAGAGAEAASVAAATGAGDSAYASESSDLLAALARTDSGAASESGSVEDVTGAVTIRVASADAGAGLEATVAIAAAPADDELATGVDNAWVLAGTVAAPYRDRQLLRLLADALRDTAEFDEVLTSGLPEDHGRTASDLRLASFELDHWADADHWGDFDSTEQVRTVAYTLHLMVRAEDPDLRDDELDRLASVASNALNALPLGDVSIPNKTRLLRGKYQAAAGPERRMALAGQFTYTLPDFGRHAAAEDV